ncbi:serine protease family protein [Parablautia muri]|uniref:trypsin-like peptidase domain-containing protein n=1 Tax=Parablautia muri TaxID=2320879 RepID=UPI00136BAF24|nr:trypsin-like peptidase domain-containing protein [Parablautia muri]
MKYEIMRYKKRVYELLAILFMMGLVTLFASKSSIYQPVASQPNASGEEALGAGALGAVTSGSGEERRISLIQATTLESDYKGMVMLGLAYTPYLEEEDLQKAFDNVLRSCVRFQVKGHYGSGSIYKMTENEIILVTNRHVLQYWNEDSYVTFFNGRVSEGMALGVSDEADVGFVSISVEEFTYEELLFFREIRMEQQRIGNGAKDLEIVIPEAGRKFFMVDMASEWNAPVMRQGEVVGAILFLEDFQAEMLYGKGDAIPGMSGCGVFDGHGYYLGMLSGGTLQSEIAAVPAQTIDAAYEKIVKGK